MPLSYKKLQKLETVLQMLYYVLSLDFVIAEMDKLWPKLQILLASELLGIQRSQYEHELLRMKELQLMVN